MCHLGVASSRFRIAGASSAGAAGLPPSDTAGATSGELAALRKVTRPPAGSTSSAFQFTVNKAVSTTGLTATGGKVKGSTTKYQVAMTATVTLNTGKPAVGTVAFYLNGVVVATAQVGANGKASTTVSAPAERVQVRAQFTPTDTANHLGSISSTLTINVK